MNAFFKKRTSVNLRKNVILILFGWSGLLGLAFFLHYDMQTQSVLFFTSLQQYKGSEIPSLIVFGSIWIVGVIGIILQMFFLQKKFLELDDLVAKSAQSDEKFIKMFLANPDPITLTTISDGTYIDVNPAFSNTTGFQWNEVIGKTFQEIELWADAEQRNSIIQLMQTEGYFADTELRLYKKNKEIITCLVSAETIEIDSKKCCIMILKNITDRKQIEKEIQFTNERFEIIARATNDAVWDWNLHTNTIWWNDNFYDYFGYPKEPRVQTLEFWIQNIHPDDRAEVSVKVFEAIEQSHNVWFARYRFQKNDGSYDIVFDRGLILRDANNKAVRMIGGMMDITEQYKMEIERENLIHGLRDALANVKTLSGLLPICSHCKKIRDDNGYWYQLEQYLTENSNALISHGICPECFQKLYPSLQGKNKA